MIVLFFLAITVAVVNCNDESLIAVVQIFANGQRTPITFFPTDPYSDISTYWEGLGNGQLTNVGKRQQYALGQFSRTRYSRWLAKSYSSSDIYVQTMDIDRTLMSAHTNLFGLYPASGTQVWQKGVTWQPIPVHPINVNILMTSSDSCPVYQALLKNVTEEEEFQTLDVENESIYKYLTNYTGLNITTFTETVNIYDSLSIEKQVGFTLPDWTSFVYPETLKTLALTAYEIYTHTTQMKRFYAGPFLNEVLSFFDKMLEDSTSSPKYQMYSAYDRNLFGILDSLGQNPKTLLLSAASIWIELKLVESKNVVSLYYKNDNNSTRLTIKTCSYNCPLTEVKALLKDILVDTSSWEEECFSL